MRRFLSSIIALLCGLLAPAMAQQAYVQSLSGTPTQSMQLWGGGLVAHQEWVLNTGVHFQMPDGSGAYLLGADNIWHQIISDRSFATAACDNGTFTALGSCFGIYPKTGTSQIVQIATNGSSGTGAVDGCGSPANKLRDFLYYNGYVFRSDNVDPTAPDSVTFINTAQLAGGGFSGALHAATGTLYQTTDSSNTALRSGGRFIACDPNNQHHMFLGTYSNGVWETKDDGNTFAQLATSDIPLSTGTTNYIMKFDANSGTNGAGLTNTICIFSNGVTAGVHCSTTGGGAGTWSVGTSSPTSIQNLAFGSGGTVWGITGTAGSSGALWTCVVSSCTWAQSSLTATNLKWVAVNPLDQTKMIAMTNGANLYSSITSGASWGPATQIPFSLPLLNGDTPWLTTLTTDIGGGNGYNVEFSPTNSGNLEFAMGQGTWTASFPQPTDANFALTSHNKGVMHPVGFSMVVPTTQSIITGSQDITGCFFNPAALPTVACHPLSISKSLAFASGIDVSKTDHTFAVEKISENLSGGADFSGYSPNSDYFKTNLIPFNSWYARVPASNISCTGGSCPTSGTVHIALSGTGFTTSGLTAWSAGQGNILCSYAEFRTTSNTLNQGPGLTSCFEVTSFNASANTVEISAAFSAGVALTGGNYMFFSPTLSAHQQYQQNIIGVQDNGGGLVQVTLMNAGSVANGQFIDISTVTMTGATGGLVNGRWLVTNKSQACRCFTLQDSSSTGIGTYSSGGVANNWIEPGGSIAAASNTNIVVAPASDGFPACTTNGGASWSQVTHSSIPVQATTISGALSAGATSITVADGTKIVNNASIWVPMDDGRYMFAIVGTKSGNVFPLATVAGAAFTYSVPPGRSIADGAVVSTGFGWDNAAFLDSQAITADTVVANTFFQANTAVGLLKWTNCNTPALVNTAIPSTSNSWHVGGGLNETLVAVPHQAGHLFYTAGPQGGITGISATGLWRACNGNSNTLVNMVRVDGFFGPLRVGFGSPIPGGSGYPSIYVYGWYDATNAPGSKSEASGVFGLWESTDDPNSGNSGTGVSCNSTGNTGGAYSQNGGSFHLVYDWPSAFPGGPKWMVLPTAISGDPTIYGPIYNQTSSGPFVGTVNFLLKRDLDPAANDNNPVGLERVG